MDENGVRLDQSFERFTQFEESQHSYSGAVRHLAVPPVALPTPLPLPLRPLPPAGPWRPAVSSRPTLMLAAGWRWLPRADGGAVGCRCARTS